MEYVQLAAEWIVGIGNAGGQQPPASLALEEHRVEGRETGQRHPSQLPAQRKFGAAVNAHRAGRTRFRAKIQLPFILEHKRERQVERLVQARTDFGRRAGPVFEHRDMGFATRVNVVLDKAVRSPVAFDHERIGKIAPRGIRHRPAGAQRRLLAFPVRLDQ